MIFGGVGTYPWSARVRAQAKRVGEAGPTQMSALVIRSAHMWWRGYPVESSILLRKLKIKILIFIHDVYRHVHSP